MLHVNHGHASRKIAGAGALLGKTVVVSKEEEK